MSILNKNNKNIIRSTVYDGLETADSIFGSSGLFTEVTIKDTKSGEILYNNHNTTVLGGRVAQLEELFGILRNSDQHVLLNNPEVLNIEHSETNTVLNSQTIRRKTSWFMVGNGATPDNQVGKYVSPKNYETRLYSPIPFRLVPLSSDLSQIEQSKYRLRRIETHDGVDYAAYYAKAFNPGSVILEHNSSTYIPNQLHTEPIGENDISTYVPGGSVLAYIQFTLDIDENEIKEFFRVTRGDLTSCNMSEIGLVMGADLPNASDISGNNRSELAAAEMVSKITSASVDLSQEGSSRQVTYRIYAK